MEDGLFQDCASLGRDGSPQTGAPTEEDASRDRPEGPAEPGKRACRRLRAGPGHRGATPSGGVSAEAAPQPSPVGRQVSWLRSALPLAVACRDAGSVSPVGGFPRLSSKDEQQPQEESRPGAGLLANPRAMCSGSRCTCWRLGFLFPPNETCRDQQQLQAPGRLGGASPPEGRPLAGPGEGQGRGWLIGQQCRVALPTAPKTQVGSVLVTHRL